MKLLLLVVLSGSAIYAEAAVGDVSGGWAVPLLHHPATGPKACGTGRGDWTWDLSTGYATTWYSEKCSDERPSDFPTFVAGPAAATCFADCGTLGAGAAAYEDECCCRGFAAAEKAGPWCMVMDQPDIPPGEATQAHLFIDWTPPACAGDPNAFDAAWLGAGCTGSISIDGDETYEACCTDGTPDEGSAYACDGTECKVPHPTEEAYWCGTPCAAGVAAVTATIAASYSDPTEAISPGDKSAGLALDINAATLMAATAVAVLGALSGQ